MRVVAAQKDTWARGPHSKSNGVARRGGLSVGGWPGRLPKAMRRRCTE